MVILLHELHLQHIFQSLVEGDGQGVGKRASGAGHGGQGGYGLAEGGGGMYYSTVTKPLSYGSGAKSFMEDSDGDVIAFGGGVIKFEVSGNIQVDGEWQFTRLGLFH